MGALAQVTPWIPEDDLLLKNSIEAGASLEALAKGAVQFSRRFSIKELQDRWYSLLYDPVVSADAAFRMAELELTTNPNFPTKFGRTGYSKENKSSSKKRPAERLRTTCQSLLKKSRTTPFPSLDIDFLDGTHFMDNGDATHFGLEDSHMDIIHNAFPEILGEDGGMSTHIVSEDHLQGDIPYVSGEDLTFTEHAGPSGCDAVHQDPNQNLENTAHEAKTTSTDYLAHLMEEDVEPFMEVDGKEVDKSYYDLSSLLGNSANDSNHEALPNSTEQELYIAQTDPGDVTLADHMIPEVDDGTGEMSSMDCKTVSESSALDPHPEIVDPHPEIVGGVINCVLNQEDPDIPCNDHINLPCHPMSVASLARRNFKDVPITASVRDPSASKERNEGYSLHTQKKNPGRLQGSTQGKPETGQPSQGSKFRAPSTVESHNTVSAGGSTCTGSAQASSNTLRNGGTGPKDGNKEIVAGTHYVGFDNHGSYLQKDRENCKEKKDVLTVNEESHDKDTDDGLIEISDPLLETTQTEAEAYVYESDEDLPNYSDIEAMILEMDLEPDDQDNFDLEVSKYQSEEMKRLIIRLEQSFHSCMQRDIASRGALAVLYGKYSKHYIKKPEVLVGRSTEDYTVDIDLGREKRGSKISRRQAILKLSDDGSYYIKNLGKYSITVKEKEVDPGESLILKTNDVVEIRGMHFIFETNQSRIQEYLNRTEIVN